MKEYPGLLADLFARRVWLIAGVLIAIAVAASRFVSIGILPPSVTVRHLAYANASTQLLVGKYASLLQSGYRDPYVNAVVPRAQTLADMMASPEVRGYIARAARLPASQIAVDTPVWSDVERIQQWPTGEKRNSQIIVENAPYRITIDVEGYAPVIDISTQAPTTREAAALASASGTGLNSYVAQLETSTGVAPSRRYGITQLVPVGVSPPGKSGLANVVLFSFATVAFIWCGGILFMSGIAADIRALRRRAKVSGATKRSSDTRAWHEAT